MAGDDCKAYATHSIPKGRRGCVFSPGSEWSTRQNTSEMALGSKFTRAFNDPGKAVGSTRVDGRVVIFGCGSVGADCHQLNPHLRGELGTIRETFIQPRYRVITGSPHDTPPFIARNPVLSRQASQPRHGATLLCRIPMPARHTRPL